MRIVINGEDGVNLQPFIISYIIPLMQSYLRSHIDKKRLQRFVDEFNIQDFLLTILKSNFLVCRKVRSTYIIEINSNIYVRNSFAKLVDICSLINYGNLTYPSYPIFTQMFSYIRKEFYTLYRIFFV